MIPDSMPISAMTEEHLWQIIQKSFDACSGKTDEQAETLANELNKHRPDEIATFARHFATYHRQACSWDLWGAAYLINGGCSDDGFADFRSWLISRGKNWYQQALINPDSLAGYPDLKFRGASFEEFAYVATQVHEKLAGDLPESCFSPDPDEPAGTAWQEDDEETFRTRWPKLFARFPIAKRSTAPAPWFKKIISSIFPGNRNHPDRR